MAGHFLKTFYLTAAVIRFQVNTPRMSDGSTSLPLGSVLSLIMCDRKGKCCSQDFSGSLYINYMFPTHHACQLSLCGLSSLRAETG